MYAKNIAIAVDALIDKESPRQKVDQWRRDGRRRFRITAAKINQLRRHARYQLAASSGKMGGWFL